MEYINYLPLQKFSLKYKYFCFIDTREHLADALFIKHKTRVWFKQEFHKEKNDFIFVICKARKKDVGGFMEALEELKGKMLLLGHYGYQEFCEEVGNSVLALSSK